MTECTGLAELVAPEYKTLEVVWESYRVRYL
jgi:hypothetical protein